MAEIIPQTKVEMEPLKLSEHDEHLLDDFLVQVLGMGTRAELDAFRSRIATHGGIVKTIVHHDYGIIKSPSQIEGARARAAERIRSGSELLLETSVKHSRGIPSLVFVESNRAPEDKNRWQSDGSRVIETQPDTGIASRKILSGLSQFEMYRREPLHQDRYSGSHLAYRLLLHGLRVKHILVAGMYLNYIPAAEGDETSRPYFGGCVRRIVEAARSLGITTQISRFTSDPMMEHPVSGRSHEQKKPWK